MEDFKRQVLEDAENIFHNISEFADILDVRYAGKNYSVPVVIDGDTMNNRKKSSSDNADGIYSVDVVAYIEREKLGFVPRKNNRIVIDDEDYNIISVSDEMGEIMLELERLDER